MISRFLLLGLLFTLLLTGCYAGVGGTSGRVVLQDDHGTVDIVFSDHDRAIIRDYYAGDQGYKHRKKMPPGLAKRDQLPPGLQKQLVRRGQLPPGLQYHPLPYDLRRRLSPLPDDFARVMVEGSFVLFNKNTRIIYDVIHDF
ncbi:MAG: hypothetical protein P8Y84_12000 [Desulfuromonadales bacterium]|jgi:hypothetical protein